jgi:hypothetical protein
MTVDAHAPPGTDPSQMTDEQLEMISALTPEDWEFLAKHGWSKAKAKTEARARVKDRARGATEIEDDHAQVQADLVQLRADLGEIETSIVGMLCTHCGGDGREPLPEIREAWWPILLRLYRTRTPREELQHARSPARMSRLYDLYDEMRKIMEDAAAANIPQTMWMQAAGISRAQVSNIYRGKVGWPAVKDDDAARVNSSRFAQRQKNDRARVNG